MTITITMTITNITATTTLSYPRASGAPRRPRRRGRRRARRAVSQPCNMMIISSSSIVNIISASIGVST